MCKAGHLSRIVWTSSSNARRSAFSMEDLQHRNGTEPYSSSKYASDMLSLVLNRHKNNQVCLSHIPQNRDSTQQRSRSHLQIRDIQSLLRRLDILTFTLTDAADKHHL